MSDIFICVIRKTVSHPLSTRPTPRPSYLVQFDTTRSDRRQRCFGRDGVCTTRRENEAKEFYVAIVNSGDQPTSASVSITMLWRVSHLVRPQWSVSSATPHHSDLPTYRPAGDLSYLCGPSLSSPTVTSRRLLVTRITLKYRKPMTRQLDDGVLWIPTRLGGRSALRRLADASITLSNRKNCFGD